MDIRGHGKSSWFKENISIRSIAKDLDALAGYLKLERINGIGYSYGGDMLIQMELLHPGLIKSMITIGTCGTWNAKEFPEFLEYLSYKNIDNLPWMREQQTSEEQIKSILAQLPNYNVTVSDAELKSIQARMLVVHGDEDVATPIECVLKVKKLFRIPSCGSCQMRSMERIKAIIRRSSLGFQRSFLVRPGLNNFPSF